MDTLERFPLTVKVTGAIGRKNKRVVLFCR